MKTVLQWACRDLNDGWVMIGVDVDLSGPDEPESLLGLRRAVHPFQFDEAVNPVIAFTAVISEMDKQIRRGVGVSALTLPASCACAFDDIPSMFPRSALADAVTRPARTTRELKGLFEAARKEVIECDLSDISRIGMRTNPRRP